MVDGTEKKTEEQPSWMERLGMDATAALDRAEKQKQEYVLAQQKTEQQREAVQKAIENGTSVLGGLLEKQKPQYDRQKEKRLRNTAIAQSIGDMLSAAARGAFAFGKKGMGYVPKVEGNSALKSIEAINEMQEEYRKRNEDWKTLTLQYKQAQAEAETEAAKQLLTAKESAEERARKRADEATAEAREAYRKYLQAGIDAEEKEAQRQWRAEDRKDRQASTAAIKALGSDKSKGKELTVDGYIFTQLRKDETYEEATTKPVEALDDEGNIVTKDVTTTSKKPKTYTIEEANAMGKYDSQVQEVKRLMDDGYSREEAIAMVKGK